MAFYPAYNSQSVGRLSALSHYHLAKLKKEGGRDAAIAGCALLDKARTYEGKSTANVFHGVMVWIQNEALAQTMKAISTPTDVTDAVLVPEVETDKPPQRRARARLSQDSYYSFILGRAGLSILVVADAREIGRPRGTRIREGGGDPLLIEHGIKRRCDGYEWLSYSC
jgi:hypothetical protein